MSPPLRTATSDQLPDELCVQLRRMLDEAYDGDFGDDDWAHALGGHHVWCEDALGVVGHASVVPRTLRCGDLVLCAGYVEAVATRSDARGRGLGTALMHAVAEIICAHHDLGALSSAADAFYEALGWVRWRGVTGVITEPESRSWTRTPDEDGGIMVLRTTRTPPLDLDAPIVCEQRSGDVW